MNKLATFNQAELNEFKLIELATVYNKLAVELGVKTIKKFRDRDTGIRRLTEIQNQYVEEFAEFKKSQKPAETKSSKPRGKYTLQSRVIRADRSAKQGTAMALVQDIVFDLTDGGANNGEGLGALVEDVIYEFKHHFKQIRGKAKINDGFARGYLTGAIREGYVEIDEA